jgi:S1-C subfamily serine protease
MADRTSMLFLCAAFVFAFGFLSGCGHKYEDQETGITIRELGSDLDNRWAFKGVVVESVEPGKPAHGSIGVGELISYIVDEREVTDEKKYREAFSEALEEDEKAILRILKVVPATSPEQLGIQPRPDPEERGVIVASVEAGSKADEVGIKRGTIIYEIDGKSIKSEDEYSRVLAEALADSDKITLSMAREIVASKLSKVGIEEVQDHSSGVIVKKMDKSKTEGTPASMEGIGEGDVITHVIDEMKITDIGSYKKAIRKAVDADRVIFKRGELGGIKLVVIDALGQIGDARAVEPLLKALESEDRWIRRSAARALEKMNDKRVIQPLLWHLLEENEEDAEVRRSSARALARMQPMEAIESLAQALKDSSLGVRLEAGYALGRIGEPAIDVLRKARYDADSRVRDSAVAALGNIGGTSARSELISVLGDENEESTVKLTAIQALNKIGDPESIAELRRMAETGDPGLRAFVKELLTEETL